MLKPWIITQIGLKQLGNIVTPEEGIKLIRDELEAGMALPKCQQCGCMRSALDALAQQLPSIAGEDGRLLAEKVDTWSNQMKPVRYACLGCEYCYPAVVENVFTSAFPDTIFPSSMSCGFQTSAEDWPVVLGEYFVIDRTAPVAVSTLANTKLAEDLAKLKLPGLAITGKTETENIGVEKVIKNIITNPAIQFLLIAGSESKGHQSGNALISLAQNGIDEKGRVIGATGKRPILRNVTQEEINALRKQVQVVDLRGCEDPKEIGVQVKKYASQVNTSFGYPQTPEQEALIPLTLIDAANPAGDCSDLNCDCHTQSNAQGLTIIVPDTDEDIALDRAGYFVILPVADRDVINVEHYSYDNTLLHTVEGTNARSIYLEIIRQGWVSELSHAAYLGKELAKAALALKYGFKYVQDGA